MQITKIDTTIFAIIQSIIGGRVFIGQNTAQIQPVVAENGSK